MKVQKRLSEGLRSGRFVRKGVYFRSSDSRSVQRYFCKKCKRNFSSATLSPTYRQIKRRLNSQIFNLKCSGVSQRQCARLLSTTRRTIVRKLIFLDKLAVVLNERLLDRELKKRGELLKYVQFDEMESFEHSKCKPLSIPLAVTSERFILGIGVCSMPAKGLLASISRKKYGFRPDHRSEALVDLFTRIRHRISPKAELLSDECPRYPKAIRECFDSVTHRTTKGLRGCIVGQGELKKAGFDPLFALNHTAAMLRAHVNRLFRKTWCTTKKPDRLLAHLNLYVLYHNRRIACQLR
ncbi:MAG: hypothetical protein A3K03_06445 [Bdellovibrionales bacterium RIFOXYD1_FULL_44_7]|nr:MAG: hypothetical protein A3K03_06445 [Bdellovibrionales bacterium RIFOXYD1_FULL_44_7]